MTFRKDLPWLEPSLTHFQAFDHGEEVTERLPEAWSLEPGDVLEWTLAQFSGTARVISCGEAEGDRVPCVVQKVS